MAVWEAILKTIVCRGTSLTVTDLNCPTYDFYHLCRSAQQFNFWHHVGSVAVWQQYFQQLEFISMHMEWLNIILGDQPFPPFFHLRHVICNLI